MSSETVALMHWRALDREGSDKCRLARLEAGWILIGHARFRDGGAWAALDYVLRADADWHVQGCDVTGTFGPAEVGLRLEPDGDGWTLNGAPQPFLAGCSDIALPFTPAAHLIPLRRLPEVGGLDCRAVTVDLPGPTLHPRAGRYTRERGQVVQYEDEGSGTRTQLAVDAQGFVTLLPGRWEQERDG